MYLWLNLTMFATVVLFIMLGHWLLFGRRIRVAQRLAEIQKIKGQGEETEEDDALARPFYERLVQPFLQRTGEVVGNLAPREIRGNIEKKILYAGSPYNLNFTRFVTVQVLFSAMLFGFFLLALTLLSQLPLGRALGSALLMSLFGLLVPMIMLNSRAIKRQFQIQRSLPDILDLIHVSVEAGLGFDMALKRVAGQAEGPLSRELARALEEMRLGKTREEALRGIVRRTGVPDLSSFISAIIQAEQLGANVVNTLRVQANTMRQRRRQRAEQQAAKAPVKIIFPLFFFIFPALMVVVLGPAMLRIIQIFGEMF